MKTTNILLGLILIVLLMLTGVIFKGVHKGDRHENKKCINQEYTCDKHNEKQASSDYTSKQEEIHERSPEVMPFTMSATKHEFNKIPGGGHQKVYVTDPSDTQNIKLIQGHLMEIAEAFQQGDFSMPKQLHGDNMPGIAYLEENPTTFAVEYIENDIGADIMYISENQETLNAIHTWFDTQVHDHGDDVAHGEMDMSDTMNRDNPCENIPEGHPAEMRRMHHGCTE